MAFLEQPLALVQEILAKYLFLITRYLLFAGLLYLVFYVWKRQRWDHFKIQTRWPRSQVIRGEVKWSLLSLFIFSLVATSVLLLAERGWTRFYLDWNAYPLWWNAASFVVVILVHDTWFYFTHRLMHWKPLFRRVHQVHHRSHNPTPWAAFAFHPLEAFIEIGILPFLAFTLPLHPATVAWLGFYSISLNVMGHLGFELFPKGFTRHWLLRWHNTSTHHNLHHSKFHCNYSLYFNFWDRILGTNHPEYDQRFDQVVQRRRTRAAKRPDQQHQPTAEAMLPAEHA